MKAVQGERGKTEERIKEPGYRRREKGKDKGRRRKSGYKRQDERGSGLKVQGKETLVAKALAH